MMCFTKSQTELDLDYYNAHLDHFPQSQLFGFASGEYDPWICNANVDYSGWSGRFIAGAVDRASDFASFTSNACGVARRSAVFSSDGQAGPENWLCHRRCRRYCGCADWGLGAVCRQFHSSVYRAPRTWGRTCVLSVFPICRC